MIQNIAICDDQIQDREALGALLSQLLQPLGAAPSIHAFSSGEALCAALRQTAFDVVFLDIVMDGMDGIDTMRALRDEDTLIVFMSTTDDRLRDMFSSNVVGFLDKPITYKALGAVMDKVRIRQAEQRSNLFSYTKNGTPFFLPYRDILYFESMGHYINLHTRQEVITYKGRIGEVWAALRGERDFCMPNRSYVVSIRHLSLTARHTVQVASTEISIGRTNRTDTMERIMTYASGRSNRL